jgi:hypothetical protein
MTGNHSPIQRFLWRIACTDEEAVVLCSPVTQSYQATAGTMVLITGVLAFISGSYAINQVVRNAFLAVMLGCVYAAGIMSMDRYIVSARGNRASWFRFPLAIIIAVVVAVPLELRLLEQRIDQELLRMERGENRDVEQRRNRQLDELQSRIAGLEQSAAGHRHAIDEWGSAMEAEVVGRAKAGRTGLAGAGPAYEAARQQKQVNQDLLNQVSGELQLLRSKEASVREQIDQDYKRSAVPQAYDLLSRYEAMHRIESQHPEAMKLGWGITILLMLFEIFPVLIKVTAPYTAYAALVEAREREDIQRYHSLANQNLSQLPTDPLNGELSVMGQAESIKSEQSEQEESENEKKRHTTGVVR